MIINEILERRFKMHVASNRYEKYSKEECLFKSIPIDGTSFELKSDKLYFSAAGFSVRINYKDIVSINGELTIQDVSEVNATSNLEKKFNINLILRNDTCQLSVPFIYYSELLGFLVTYLDTRSR